MAISRASLTIINYAENANRLLHFLINHDVIILDENDYHDFRVMHDYLNTGKADPGFGEGCVARLDAILEKITIKSVKKIRLLAGYDDDYEEISWYALKIIEKLCKENVSIDFVFSAGLVDLIVRQRNKKIERLLDARWISGVEQLVSCCKNRLRLFSYQHSAADGVIVIYSHIRIGMGSIRLLAKAFSVTYDDSTIEKLIETINTIERVFSDSLSILSKDKLDKIALILNRDSILKDTPIQLNGYTVVFVTHEALLELEVENFLHDKDHAFCDMANGSVSDVITVPRISTYSEDFRLSSMRCCFFANSRCVIDQEANLEEYPGLLNCGGMPEEREFTIGDLHANALKFIYFLTRERIFQMFPPLYSEFVNLYTRLLKKVTADDYRQILSEYKDSLDRVGIFPGNLVRLIGDETGDRGCNDYLILLIIKKLLSHDLSVKIMLSNHGSLFIETYEQENNITLKPACLLEDGNSTQRSLVNLHHSILCNVINPDDVRNLIDQYYKPSLYIVDYAVGVDRQSFTLFTHALVGLTMIRYLAEKLEVFFNDSSIEKYAATLDAIQAKFKTYVMSNRVHTLCTQPSTDELVTEEVIRRNVVYFIMNNRDATICDRPNIHPNGMRMHFVNGHHHIPHHWHHIHGLNSALGMFSKMDGEYSVYTTDQSPIACDAKPSFATMSANR